MSCWIGKAGVKVFLSVITAPIVLAYLIDFLIRWCYVNPQMFKYSSCKFVPAMPIQDKNTSVPIYWRWHVISATTNGANKKGDALQNSHRFPYSSRHRLLIKLEQAETEIRNFTRNYTFKLKRTLDRHSPRQKLNYCFLPNSPIFRYHLPIKVYKYGLQIKVDYRL